MSGPLHAWLDSGPNNALHYAASKWSRQLRLATDCSGIRSVEVAAHAAAQAGLLPPLDFVWKSDCYEVLQLSNSIYPHTQPRHSFADVTARRFLNVDGPQFKDVGSNCTISRGDDIDFYVAGFPCQPFSSKGLRGGFDDSKSSTFWSILKTASVIRPRVLILENVPGLLNKRHWDQVLGALTCLKGYVVMWETYRTHEHTLPHFRSRVYITCIREDAVCKEHCRYPGKPAPQMLVRLRARVEQFMLRCVSHGLQWAPDAESFLDAAGLAPSTTSAVGAQVGCGAQGVRGCHKCQCSLRQLCPKHPCKCRHGARPSLKCKWRVNTALYVKRSGTCLKLSSAQLEEVMLLSNQLNMIFVFL